VAEPRGNHRLQWAVFATLSIVEFGLLAGVLFGAREIGMLVGSMTVVAALLVITIRVFDLGSLSVGKDGVRAELKAVKEQIAEADRRIDELFLQTMSPAMFLNLKKLTSRCFGPYEMGPGLERELRHLRDIGYVDVRAIGSIPKTGTELAEFAKVTPAGQRFVAMRDQLERKQNLEANPYD
jgi:hypothetical protein